LRRNTILEYNYSHDNGGAGILFLQHGDGNVTRYNVSVNDSTQLKSGSGSFQLTASGTVKIYNNTVYRSGAYPGATPSCFNLSDMGVYGPGVVLSWGATIPHTLGSGYNMGADGGRH
jgi:hypothetical protein